MRIYGQCSTGQAFLRNIVHLSGHYIFIYLFTPASLQFVSQRICSTSEENKVNGCNAKMKKKPTVSNETD